MMLSVAPFSQLIMLGAGGHASVLHALALAAGHHFIGICDPELCRDGVRFWKGIRVLGDDSALADIDKATMGLVNGIGQLVGNRARQLVFERSRKAGFSFPVLIHPFAWVADGVDLKQGVQVMAGAIIQPESIIGENTIVNTNASVDHGCVIGGHVHIAPGATLCGGVTVGDGAFVGAGSTLVQNVFIGSEAVVGAGAVVIKDLEPSSKLIGASMRRTSMRVNQ